MLMMGMFYAGIEYMLMGSAVVESSYTGIEELLMGSAAVESLQWN
jgi:hypothetical protein